MTEYRSPYDSSDEEEDQPFIFDSAADFERSAESKEDESSVSSAGSYSSRGGTPAFTEAERKQLVVDIEKFGGIDSVSTKQLCDSKPSIYGAPKTPLRTKTRNQIYRWQKKQRPDYNSLLLGAAQKDAHQEANRIPPPSQRTTQRRTPPQSPARNLVPAVARRSLQQARSPPRSPPAIAHARSRALPPSATPRAFRPTPSTIMASNFTVNLLSQPYEPINVLLDYPERNNGPFFVTYFPNHVDEDTGTLHNAYHIELQDQDMQWMLTGESESFFAAYHIGENRVMFKVPSGSFSLLKDSATEDAGKKAAGYDEPRSIEAYNVERNAIVNDPDRQFKYYLLSFPCTEDLNNEIFSPNSENGKLRVDVHPTVKTFTLPGDTPTSASSYRCSIVWDIAIEELVPRYVKSAKPRENETVNSLMKNLKGLAVEPVRSASLSKEDNQIRSNAARLVNEATMRENNRSTPAVAPATQPVSAPATPATSTTLVPYEARTDISVNSGTYNMLQRNKLTSEVAHQSRLKDVESARKAKRDEKINNHRFPPPPPPLPQQPMSSLAAAEAAGASETPPDPIVMEGNIQVVGADGEPLRVSQLQNMISQMAHHRGEPYEATRLYLQNTTTVQAFVNDNKQQSQQPH